MSDKTILLERYTIGALIDALKQVPGDARCEYSFPGVTPTDIDSYRGYYDQAALGWQTTSRSRNSAYYNDKFPEYPDVDRVIQELNRAVGGTYEGWKGGYYHYGLSTKLWVDNPGDCNGYQITGVRYNGYSVILIVRHEDED